MVTNIATERRHRAEDMPKDRTASGDRRRSAYMQCLDPFLLCSQLFILALQLRFHVCNLLLPFLKLLQLRRCKSCYIPCDAEQVY